MSVSGPHPHGGCASHAGAGFPDLSRALRTCLGLPPSVLGGLLLVPGVHAWDTFLAGVSSPVGDSAPVSLNPRGVAAEFCLGPLPASSSPAAALGLSGGSGTGLPASSAGLLRRSVLPTRAARVAQLCHLSHLVGA